MGLGTTLSRVLHCNIQGVREFLAEFLGTFMFILIADGSVAQWMVDANKPDRREPDFTNTPFLNVNFGFTLGIAFGVYICGGVSGGHINPAISLAMAVIGRLKWIKVPIYWAGQMLGAFVASIVIYIVYYDALTTRLGADHKNVDSLHWSGGIWATYPADDKLRSGILFLDQLVGTAILAMMVMAFTDKRNMGVPKWQVPILAGCTVGAVSLAFGWNCGFAINPARDFGPRLFTVVFGWGGAVFSKASYFFWIPIVAPLIGAIVGAFLYLVLIEIHWPDEEEENVQEETPSQMKYRGNYTVTVQ
jgi:aquaporin-9